MGFFSSLFGGAAKSAGRLRRTTSRYGPKGSFRKARGIDFTKRGSGGKFRPK